MRRCVWMLALGSACKIADTHFIGLGGDDAATSDTVADSPVAFDAPFAVTSHAYLVDTQAGIVVLARSMTGALAFTGVSYVMPAFSAAIDKVGKRLYVAVTNPPVIRSFTIQMDGNLVQLGADQPLNGCTPQEIALSPTRNLLAVGCTSSEVATLLVDAQGVPAPATLTQLSLISSAPGTPAFSPDGRCLYFADSSGFGMQNVHPFTVDLQTGAINQLTAQAGPPGARGIAVDPAQTRLYVAGNGQMPTFSIASSCSLTANTTQNAVVGAAPQQIVFDPTGKYVYIVGTEVYAYSYTNGNPTAVTGSPFLTNGPSMTGAVVDSALGLLYLTSAGEVMTAQLTPAGSVTAGTSVSLPNATHARSLQLGP